MYPGFDSVLNMFKVWLILNQINQLGISRHQFFKRIKSIHSFYYFSKYEKTWMRLMGLDKSDKIVLSVKCHAVIVKNYLVNEKERNVIRLSDKSQVKLEVTNLKCIFVYVFVIIIITMMLYCCTFWLLSHEKKLDKNI